MPGVRVQHPEARNAIYTVLDPTRKYAVPRQCPPPKQGGCGQVHVFKTYHLRLDDTGAVMVNDVLYGRLKDRLAASGFVVTGEVLRPPPQVIGSTAAMPRLDLSLPLHPQE